MSKMFKQRLMGLGLLVMFGVMLWVASTGTTWRDTDVTGAVFILPIAFALLFSKKVIIF